MLTESLIISDPLRLDSFSMEVLSQKNYLFNEKKFRMGVDMYGRI
jgi:hypothetical protein